MSLKLRDSTGSVYTFPETFDLEDNSFIVRFNEQRLAFSHGSKDAGDGKLRAKRLRLNGVLHASSQSAFQTAWDSMATALLKEDQELLYDDLYHIKVKRCIKATNEFIPGVFNQANHVSVTLFCEDPRWYNESISLQTISVTTDPQTTTVTNAGGLETHPIIRLQKSVSYELVQISNLDGQSESFTYADTGFVGDGAGGGTEVVLSTAFALATRGTVDGRQYFQGSWPALAGGGNDLQIEGLSGGTVIVEWRDARL